ncbi:MAG: DNA cytosine methyltransferase [Clostridia bacterium]|nr:DNA cytosine methyltransferase [Clostridia bacterium]
MTNLKLGSLFDGSGGFPLGGVMAGITPVWASEVEPFAVRVTTKRFPFMKHYGDISAMDGGKIEPVDIITFGSPCQDMSVAGKRDGLDGKRSGLFYEAVRIIKEMRRATNGKYPRWICWENVPGAFSSNNGYDFKAVLEAVIGIAEEGTEVPMPEKTGWPYADVYLGDGWSVAYRTLDAQYWGVPQRRRRIYLVADFAGRSAGDVLFKSEGVSGYSAESFRAWQRAANGAEDSTGAPGFGLDGYNGRVSDKAATLGVNCGMSTGRNGVVLNDQGGNRMDVTDEVTCTLRAEAHHPPCVLESAGFCTEHSAKSRTIGYEEELSPTLRAGVVPAAIALENHPNDGRIKIEDEGKVQTLSSRMGTGGNNVPLVMKIRSGCEGGGKGALIQTDKSATLACNNDQTLFVPSNWDGGQIAPTLTKQNAGGNQRMPDKDNFNCVLQPFGICSKDSNSMKSSNPHSGIYEAETARTLDGNGGNPACNQGGIAIVCVDQPETVTKSETIVIEGNGSRPSHKGNGYKESDVMYTLNTIDRHAVYAMSTGSYAHIEEEKSPTLLARDYKDPNAVCYGIGRDAFNQGKNAKYMPSVSEGSQPTLVAKGPGAVAYPFGFDPSCARDLGKYFLEDCGNTLLNGTCPGHHNGVLETDYTVRRLTPTECARLQGFPDWWCSGLEERYPAIQDIRFWQEVWDTYARVIGGCKPKTEKQVRKWLEHPHSDSAEYKLWGNGVALPCVFFVLSGIVYYTQDDGE